MYKRQVKQYTIKQSGVWEHKVIHIPPQTIGGAMTIDNTVGYYLYWFLGGSSSYNGTALTDNWVSYLTPRRNEGGNATLDSGDYWMITGIQLEVGNNATEFEHRSYGEELALCQRYFFKISNSRLVMGYKRHDNDASFAVNTPVPMRAQPTPSLIAGGTFTNFQSSFSTTQSNPGIYEWSEFGSRFIFKVDSTWSSTHTYVPSWEGFTAEFDSEF